MEMKNTQDEIIQLKKENIELKEEIKKLNALLYPTIKITTPIVNQQKPDFTMSEDSLKFWKSRWDYY